MELTQEFLKERLHYHEDGYFIWKIRPNFYKVKMGDRAGCLQKFEWGDRYTLRIGGKLYLVSRLVFFWHHGWFPRIVDHKDRVTTNDRIGNLRESDLKRNSMNSCSHKNSSSKYKGVGWDTRKKTWRAYIQINQKYMHLGYFEIEEDAALAYNEVAKIHHGEYANLNITS